LTSGDADSDRYESDLARLHARRYRHWVIEALNRDTPFNEFTIEQIVGDLLPSRLGRAQSRNGFHRNALTNREGGVYTEESRMRR
jgi:hypothetical protein